MSSLLVISVVPSILRRDDVPDVGYIYTVCIRKNTDLANGIVVKFKGKCKTNIA